METIYIENLKCFSWIGQREDNVNMVYKLNGKLEGIKWKWIRFGLRPYIFPQCNICKKHRRTEEILSVSAHKIVLPK